MLNTPEPFDSCDLEEVLQPVVCLLPKNSNQDLLRVEESTHTIARGWKAQGREKESVNFISQTKSDCKQLPRIEEKPIS
jgi:hypothetical protein